MINKNLGSEKRVTSPFKRRVAGSIPAMNFGSCSSVGRAGTYLFSNFSLTRLGAKGGLLRARATHSYPDFPPKSIKTRVAHALINLEGE